MNKVVAQTPHRIYVYTAAHGFWHLSPDVWTAVGTCVAGGAAVVALAVALIFGRRQLREARTLRREQAQPQVAVFIEETGTGIHQYNLAVKNFGATTATNVRVRIDPKPRSANLRNSNAENLLTIPEVISTLVPGQQWDIYWDWSGALDEAKDLPRVYKAEVSFSDSRSKHVDTYHFVLDWDNLIARNSVTRYGIHQAADSLQQISTAIRDLTNGQRSITTHNFDGVRLRKQGKRNHNQTQRRWRVAGNTDDDPTALDRLRVRAEKLSVRVMHHLGNRT